MKRDRQGSKWVFPFSSPLRMSTPTFPEMRVALITGAASGIGLGIAQRLSESGAFHIAMHGSRSEGEAAEAMEIVRKAKKHSYQKVFNFQIISQS